MSTVDTATGAAQLLLATVLDPATFRSWDVAPDRSGADAEYRAALVRAARRSAADESVLTGEGHIHGRRVAVVCSEFAFLAGSIGVAAADRIVRAVERATAERLPLLASTASGGTRMQEGTAAFVRMADIAGAVAAHKAAGLPYLVHLRHPTTGGVFASWGSLGHVTAAEPGALVGFLGPKVFEALNGEPFPADVQTAEALHAHGIVDAVLPTSLLAPTVARVLDLLVPAAHPAPSLRLPVQGAEHPADTKPEPTAWEAVTRSRRPGRPGLYQVLRFAEDTVPLAGTGAGERGEGLLLALARFGGVSCVLAGQDRRTRRPIGPADLRTARRGMQMAAELGLPFVTVVDTAGGELSPEAEHGGLAGEIARCLAALQALPVPTLSVLLGQGSGGVALALLPADRVVAARHSWLGPLAPEGAAAIRYGDVTKAPMTAADQAVGSAQLRRAGVVDTILDERPDAAEEPREFSMRVAAAIGGELAGLRSGQLIGSRARRRFRSA